MPQEQSPAYQWYVKDWRSSRKVQLMSFKERGMYREMLDEQWEAVTVPNDPAALAALLGGTVAEWTRCLVTIRPCFTVLPDGRLQNQRLERERAKQRKRSVKAALGAAASNAQQDAKRHLNVTRAPLESPPSDALLLHLPIAIASASEVQRASGAHDAIDLRAGTLVNRYGELFIKHRFGAKHLQRPNLDWEAAKGLVALWSDERLDKLAVLVLTTDDPWISGTDRSFKIFAMKASWADERLAAWEAEHNTKVRA
jgi:uncharacterized protein YdaU (DUF1376 family)